MSFLEVIGEIISGNGLLEASSVIYAEGYAQKALTDHSFVRSMHGHIYGTINCSCNHFKILRILKI